MKNLEAPATLSEAGEECLVPTLVLGDGWVSSAGLHSWKMDFLSTQTHVSRAWSLELELPPRPLLYQEKECTQREGSGCLECGLGDMVAQDFVRVKKPLES